MLPPIDKPVRCDVSELASMRNNISNQVMNLLRLLIKLPAAFSKSEHVHIFSIFQLMQRGKQLYESEVNYFRRLEIFAQSFS